MEALIKVTENDLGKVVSARELHEFLGVQSKFADWIKNRIKEYVFVENQDFTTFSKILEKGRPELEYVITLDMAKELAMVEKTDKGREARQYFIACEKALQALIKEPILTMPHLERLRELRGKIYWHHEDIEKLKIAHKQALEKMYVELKELEQEQKYLRQLPSVCQYCGKTTKNFYANPSHENHCIKNPKNLQLVEMQA